MFVIALTESLAVVGLLVPGAVVMVSAGAFIGLGVLDFWSTFIAAVFGAIFGDGISFWLGHYYAGRLRSVWPFQRYPQWLSRGEDYFHRHGGKSIFLGRFVGPVRPFVPVVAGMLGMRPALFYGINIASALAWAPAYLIPGMAFGASLALAGQVAARLTALILLLGILIWVMVLFIRWLYGQLSPRAETLAQSLLQWMAQHRWMNRLFGGLLDPQQPEFKTLLALGGVLIAATWLFLGVLEDVISGDPLVGVDQGLYQFLQSLRTPSADRVMVFITEMGDGIVIAAIAGVMLLWFLWRRNLRAAAYWVAAVGFGQLAATLIKVLIQRDRPYPELYDGLSLYAFPSGHATMSVVVYGYLAVLIAGQVSLPRRWLTYALATVFVSAITVSRLYLGAHWLSDVLGGLSLGLVWVSLLGIAYYRHPQKSALPRYLPVLALGTLLLAGTWQVSQRYSADLQRYAPHLTMQQMPASAWWQDDWQRLPVYRQDLEGEFVQPLNVQWHGALADLRQALLQQGWRDPVSFSFTTVLRWLQPDPRIADLPLLPQVHAGRDDALRLSYSPGGDETNPQQLVLRLWPSGVQLEPGRQALWVGNVSYQQLRHLPLVTYPIDDRRYDAALEVLQQSLTAAALIMTEHYRPEHAVHTDGARRVLLIRERQPRR